MTAAFYVLVVLTLLLIGLELAGVVGRLGEISEALQEQNRHYGVGVPPTVYPAEDD